MRHPSLYAALVVCAALITLQSFILNFPFRTDVSTFDTSSEGRMLDQLSTSLRKTMASAIFLRCDEYMHLGDPIKMVVREKGVVVRESDVGMSWHQNVEISTLLKFSTVLDPTFTEAHSLLALHYTKDRQQFRNGIRHLQSAIHHNRKHPRLYMLYGQIGEFYYDNKSYAQARSYLEKAMLYYPRVRDSALLQTPFFEDLDDERRSRAYRAFLTSAYFELRDWPNCFKWWRDHGLFSPTNRISRWMLTWSENQNAVFRAEDYPADISAPRTEANRKVGEDVAWEQGKHPHRVMTADFPKEFYQKLGFLLCVTLGLFGMVLFLQLW